MSSNKTPARPPEHWGASAASFYADCEGKAITIHLESSTILTGVLLGIDRYDIILEVAGGEKILVPKHAIAYIELTPHKAVEV